MLLHVSHHGYDFCGPIVQQNPLVVRDLTTNNLERVLPNSSVYLVDEAKPSPGEWVTFFVPPYKDFPAYLQATRLCQGDLEFPYHKYRKCLLTNDGSPVRLQGSEVCNYLGFPTYVTAQSN